jgi:hypothetical protein
MKCAFELCSNEATTTVRVIVNGELTDVKVCADCNRKVVKPLSHTSVSFRTTGQHADGYKEE